MSIAVLAAALLTNQRLDLGDVTDVAKAIDLEISSLLGFIGCRSRVRCDVQGVDFMLKSRSLVTFILWEMRL